jgi:hypothetical protein
MRGNVCNNDARSVIDRGSKNIFQDFRRSATLSKIDADANSPLHVLVCK